MVRRQGYTVSPMLLQTNFETLWKGGAVLEMTMEQAEIALNKTVEYLAEQAKVRAPYDTGLLQDSIQTWDAEQRGNRIVASYGVPKEHKGTDMLYGYWQEVGFTHVGSGKKVQNAYLLPALEENFPATREVFFEAWDL